MGKQRKTWSAEVKEQIVLSVLRGELSTAEAARQHGVNESLVHTWKANFLDAGRARLAGERQDHGHAALERENARLVAELGRQAREDALTGLPNRRSFTEALEKAFTHARRYERPLAVALADVDDFKKINDRFSHAVGDEVLKTVAALFRGALRDGDLAARVGDEEFAFVFPETDEQEARAVCERVRETVAGHDWRGLHPGLRVSVSVGVSGDTGVKGGERLLAQADARLYEAKRSGKNRLG